MRLLRCRVFFCLLGRPGGGRHFFFYSSSPEVARPSMYGLAHFCARERKNSLAILQKKKCLPPPGLFKRNMAMVICCSL